MNESVQFDLRGEDYLLFTNAEVTHSLLEHSSLRLPSKALGRPVIVNRPLPYVDIEQITLVRRKQWWTLVPSILFIPLGLLWTATNFHAPGPLGFSLFALLVLGIFPAWLFVRGRPFLAIAGNNGLILIPADRQRHLLRRILGLLAQCNLSQNVWQLKDTPFENPATWDTRPPKETGFEWRGYALFSAAIFVIALPAFIAEVTTLDPRIFLAVRLTGCAILVVWLVRLVIVRFKNR